LPWGKKKEKRKNGKKIWITEKIFHGLLEITEQKSV
jgi:hypothetical protein